jgi:hypothetical protein
MLISMVSSRLCLLHELGPFPALFNTSVSLGSTPHVAVKLPGTPPTAKPRESIEIRFLLWTEVGDHD